MKCHIVEDVHKKIIIT